MERRTLSSISQWETSPNYLVRSLISVVSWCVSILYHLFSDCDEVNTATEPCIVRRKTLLLEHNPWVRLLNEDRRNLYQARMPVEASPSGAPHFIYMAGATADLKRWTLANRTCLRDNALTRNSLFVNGQSNSVRSLAYFFTSDRRCSSVHTRDGSHPPRRQPFLIPSRIISDASTGFGIRARAYLLRTAWEDPYISPRTFGQNPTPGGPHPSLPRLRPTFSNGPIYHCNTPSPSSILHDVNLLTFPPKSCTIRIGLIPVVALLQRPFAQFSVSSNHSVWSCADDPLFSNIQRASEKK